MDFYARNIIATNAAYWAYFVYYYTSTGEVHWLLLKLFVFIWLLVWLSEKIVDKLYKSDNNIIK